MPQTLRATINCVLHHCPSAYSPKKVPRDVQQVIFPRVSLYSMSMLQKQIDCVVPGRKDNWSLCFKAWTEVKQS